MIRIAWMVAMNLVQVPVWLYKVWRMGRETDTHTEQERYEYLRYIVKKVNRSGRVLVKGFGEEYIPKQDGFILFPNHQGLFDMMALIGTCPNHLSVVIKKEAASIFLVKQIIELLRGIAIDRNDLKESMRMIAQMGEEVKNGRNYVIFAEGTRSRAGNQILNFKGGTFKSAVRANCPIVPVALINSFKPFDHSSIRKEEVQVHFMEPIYPEQYIGLKTIQIADIVHKKIQDKIDENILINQEKMG